MLSRSFWQDAIERAVKTVAQTAIAGLTVTGVTGILDVAWPAVASASALAGLVSLLTSIASDRFGDPGTASIVGRHAE